MSNNQDSWDAITGIFYLAHIVPLKRGNSFLGPCSSGGPCQPSGLSKYHHTSAWIDSSHLPDCLCHPLPASDRTPDFSAVTSLHFSMSQPLKRTNGPLDCVPAFMVTILSDWCPCHTGH